MARLSVYVPDRTWDAVRAVYPAAGSSEIVQMGLARLLEPKYEPPSPDLALELAMFGMNTIGRYQELAGQD